MADRNVFVCVFGMPGEELLLDMVGWLLLLLLASKLLVVLDVLWLSLLLLLLAGLEEELDLDLRCGCKKCPTMLEWKKQTKLAGWLASQNQALFSPPRLGRWNEIRMFWSLIVFSSTLPRLFWAGMGWAGCMVNKEREKQVPS